MEKLFIKSEDLIQDSFQLAMPEIRVATPYFKPTKNKTKRKPDYYLHETDKWLVFPHELEGLSMQEIKENKPEVSKLIDQISPLIK